jgi:ABC-type hemin transport system ATPase subunit
MLKEGRVFGHGTCHAILEKRTLNQLFGAPVEVARGEDGRYRMWAE